jgi:hypothetical protein
MTQKQITKNDYHSNIKDYILEFLSSPPVQALSQLTPISAAVNSLFSGEYNKKKYEEITEALHLLHSRLQTIDKKYIDQDFYESEKGKRVFAMAFSSLIKDSRKQKLNTTSTLLVNLALKSKLTYDERELFVDILDALNPFQLTVLGRIYEFNKESTPSLRKFEPSGVASYFEDKGVDTQLTHQAIAVLSNQYLVSRGSDPTLGSAGDNYHFTELGERFYVFITKALESDSPYLSLT